MPRITKVKSKQPMPTPTSPLDEVAEKPIVQQIMESLEPLPAKAKKAKAAPKAEQETAPAPASAEPKSARKPNAWLDHVREYRSTNPEVSYKQAMVNAKASYKNA